MCFLINWTRARRVMRLDDQTESGRLAARALAIQGDDNSAVPATLLPRHTTWSPLVALVRLDGQAEVGASARASGLRLSPARSGSESSLNAIARWWQSHLNASSGAAPPPFPGGGRWRRATAERPFQRRRARFRRRRAPRSSSQRATAGPATCADAPRAASAERREQSEHLGYEQHDVAVAHRERSPHVPRRQFAERNFIRNS
jgi:hypothetical protein